QERHEYDVIHVLELGPLAAVAALVGKSAQKPVIISIQSSGPSAEQRARLKRTPMLMADTLAAASWLKIDPEMWAWGDTVGSMPHSALGGAALMKFLRRSHATYQILSTRSRSVLTAYGFRPEQIVHIC